MSSTRIVPPCSATISFTIGSPSPFRTGLAALNAGTAAPQSWSPPTGTLIAERILPDAGRFIVLGQTPGGLGPPTALAVDPASGAVAWTRTLGIGSVFDGVRASARMIVGGSFQLTDGSNIRMLASLDPDTGVVDPAWAPMRAIGITPPPAVYAVAVVGSTVFVGGSFTEFGGVPRANLAAVDVALATVTAWAPEADGTVRDLAPGPGTTLYVAGAFRRAGGLARDGLAGIDATGAVTTWTPQAHSIDVRTVQVAGGQLLAGCTSAVAGGVARDLAIELVVENHRRNRREQAESGGEQRLRNARRHHGEARVLADGDRLEARHDAPHRPE